MPGKPALLAAVEGAARRRHPRISRVGGRRIQGIRAPSALHHAGAHTAGRRPRGSHRRAQDAFQAGARRARSRDPRKRRREGRRDADCRRRGRDHVHRARRRNHPHTAGSERALRRGEGLCGASGPARGDERPASRDRLPRPDHRSAQQPPEGKNRRQDSHFIQQRRQPRRTARGETTDGPLRRLAPARHRHRRLQPLLHQALSPGHAGRTPHARAQVAGFHDTGRKPEKDRRHRRPGPPGCRVREPPERLRHPHPARLRTR